MRRNLNRRQADLVCGSEGEQGVYNLDLQIGALFIILSVSTLACAFPVVAARLPRLRLPIRLLFVARHFGTGVLLATAFVHLMPTAYSSLTDPCLPPFWNERYPALAGAIALGSVFAIAGIEMVFSPGRKCCDLSEMDQFTDASPDSNRPSEPTLQGYAAGADPGPLHGRYKSPRTHSTGFQFNRIISKTDVNDPQISITQTDEQSNNRQETKEVEEQLAVEPSSNYNIEAEATTALMERKKAAMQCLLLEMGILFHSVFIGMSLAVSRGSDMTVLLVAIAFHQLFEGLALGSRIATVSWSRSWQPWLMALAYGCTTPIGQALGIATHKLYDPASMTGLLVVGIMNAISAGLLTFTSLVDLLSEDFLSDESWNSLRGRKRTVAFGLVFFGAFLMSLVGAWA